MTTNQQPKKLRQDQTKDKEGSLMQTAHRPIAVAILAVLAFTSGLLGLLGSLSILSGSAILSGRGIELPDQVLTFGWILLAISAGQVVFGYTAWTLRPGAWPLGLALQVTSLAVAFVYLAIGAELYSQLGGLILASVSIVLLLMPDVRRAFGKIPRSWR